MALISSRPRYDEILKANAKSVFFFVPKQETMWYFVDTFCKILHDLVYYPFKPLRKKLYHCEVQLKCSKDQ